jgi:predicted RNA binding protein YcfA (HicA-like mRNA interferase family)
MSKLYSSKDIEYVLKKLNFNLISQKGSHGKYKNPSGRIVILPMEIPMGTFRSILRQIGINLEEFKKILKE